MNIVADPNLSEHDAWYASWFDSPYYHILYSNRDEEEAKAFIDALLAHLDPPLTSAILDLACGKGRYSRYLAQKGFANVVGLDLSEKSIRYAREYESDRLSFYTHDMRLPYRTNYFDYIFNFFTSFGYFEHENDDLRTLKAVASGLRPKGIFVLDFFNAQYVIDRLTGEEEKTINGIHFHIYKQIRGNQVTKTIDFAHAGQSYHFEERVRLYFPEDFERLFAQAGLRITERFGDYQLHAFDLKNSPRLILVAQRL